MPDLSEKEIEQLRQKSKVNSLVDDQLHKQEEDKRKADKAIQKKAEDFLDFLKKTEDESAKALYVRLEAEAEKSKLSMIECLKNFLTGLNSKEAASDPKDPAEVNKAIKYVEAYFEKHGDKIDELHKEAKALEIETEALAGAKALKGDSSASSSDIAAVEKRAVSLNTRMINLVDSTGMSEAMRNVDVVTRAGRFEELSPRAREGVDQTSEILRVISMLRGAFPGMVGDLTQHQIWKTAETISQDREAVRNLERRVMGELITLS